MSNPTATQSAGTGLHILPISKRPEKKRKEPTLYAVKRPDGTLLNITVTTDDKECWFLGMWPGDEMHSALGQEFVAIGGAKEIASLKSLGYRVVKVKLVEVG